MAVPPSPESAEVEAFIAARRLAVARRAITALADAPTADLAATAHRLAGTLGTYGLDAAEHAVLDLLARTRDGADRDEVEAARAEAIAALDAVARDLRPAREPR